MLKKVMVYLFVSSKRWDNVRKGIIWHCAMNGNITIFSFLCAIGVDEDHRRRKKQRNKR